MSFSKKTRIAVHEKYGGRCAYCGRKIELKDMQVDHFVPQRGWNESGSNELPNLMPACRMCNHYGHTVSRHSVAISQRSLVSCAKTISTKSASSMAT